MNCFSINLPASKSISNRALILNALSYCPYSINNLSDCNDTKVLFDALVSNENKFDIEGTGTAMRFLTAYFSKIVGEWYITGDARMKQRPIGVLVDAINRLGGRIEYTENEGYPPLKIFGSALVGGEIEIEGDTSSQFISSLLMIAPTMEKGLTLNIKGKIISKPYINMTLALMKKFGVAFSWKGNVINVPPDSYIPIPIMVESDWSAASYWFEIMALSNDNNIFYLKGLEKNSIQGDSIVVELFKQFGVMSKFSHHGLKLEKNGTNIKKFRYDFSDNPDLTQTFAVTCAFLNIPFIFTGLQTLKIKESDRISALTNELRKFGYDVKNNNSDSLWWDGTKIEKQKNIQVETYNDHRMALAFAPALLKTDPFEIINPNIVMKSYPSFWDDFKKVYR